MADVEGISPGHPIRPIGRDPQRRPPEREKRDKPPARERLTDDQGEQRDDEPLIDDFA